MTEPPPRPQEQLYAAPVPDTHRVALVATSPAHRAARRARPAAVVVLAVLVVLALLLLPISPTLTSIMGSAMAVLLATLVATCWRTGSTKPLQGLSLSLLATTLASAVFVGGAATRYLTSLLLAPLLGPPESPITTLLWSLPTVVVLTAFLVWAAYPIKPR